MANMSAVAPWLEAREALLASNWWALAVRGVAAVLLGSAAIFAPDLTLVGLVLIFAAYCLVDGVFAIVLAVRGARAGTRWGWLAFNGVISLAASAIAFLFPAMTLLALGIVFAIWAVISGAASIAAGVELSRSHGRWWLIIGGAAAILFAFMAVLWPEVGLLTLSFLIGFYALLAGCFLLALAYQLRERSLELAEPSSSAGSEAPAGSTSATGQVAAE